MDDYRYLLSSPNTWSKKIKEIEEEIKRNSFLSLSLEDRKILLLNNCIKANESYEHKSSDLKKKALELSCETAMGAFNFYDFYVMFEPSVFFKNKEVIAYTYRLKEGFALDSFEKLLSRAFIKDKNFFLYYFQHYIETMSSSNTVSTEFFLPIVRFGVYDFDYKSYLVNKRFSQK